MKKMMSFMGMFLDRKPAVHCYVAGVGKPKTIIMHVLGLRGRDEPKEEESSDAGWYDAWYLCLVEG